MDSDFEDKENFTVYSSGGKSKDVTLSNILLGLIVVMIVITIYVLAFQYGWNMSVHELFNQRELTFSSSLGLLIVVFILGIVFFRR
jgi:uncharacterized membrane protein